MEIKINLMEAYAIFKAIEARREWITDDVDADQGELPHLQSVYDKLLRFQVKVDIDSQTTSCPKCKGEGQLMRVQGGEVYYDECFKCKGTRKVNL